MADICTQFTLKQTCKYFSTFDIQSIVDKQYSSKLSDEILLRYPFITELNIKYNRQITNKIFEHLPHLHTLYASETKITDEGDINHFSGLY